MEAPIGNFFVLKAAVGDLEKPISKWAKSRKPPFFHTGNIFIVYSAPELSPVHITRSPY